MIKIMIADDHPIVRAGLKQIIAEDSEMVVADEASNGHEVLDKACKKDFDVIVLDITMPGMDGLDVLKQLRIDRPGLPVVILTFHPEAEYAVRVLRAGASGYITKASVPAELIKAVRKVYGGGKYVSPSLAEKLASDLNSESEKMPHETLSDREYQVMCMIASGKTVKEVADELALSIKTISTYRSRILEKMKMRNNAQLTHYAIVHRLAD